MSLIKTFSPVIDIYCGLNQISIEFHLAYEFFRSLGAVSQSATQRTQPHPSTPPADCALQLAVSPKETVVISNMHMQKISVFHSGGQRGVNNVQPRFNLN